MTIRLPVRIDSAAKAKAYFLGGKATFTLYSLKTKKYLTYRIVVCKSDARFHFVWAHTHAGYRYVGAIKESTKFKPISYFVPTKKSLAQNHFLFKVFKWVWGHVYNDSLPFNLLIYHDGTCCRCGRLLTDPESIKRGIGPECIKYFEFKKGKEKKNDKSRVYVG